MKSGGQTLVLQDARDVDRLLDTSNRFGRIETPSGVSWEPLAPAINAAYLACGCETARLCAFVGLVLGGSAAFWLVPGQGLGNVAHYALSAAAGILAFAVLGGLGERYGRWRARRRLEGLAGQVRGMLGAESRG